MELKRAYSPVLHFEDINGRPLVGGKLYTYAANSSLPATTYRDKEGTLANENPVPLNERGECEVWLVEGRNYKFVLKDRNEVTIWEKDDVSVDYGEGGGGTSPLPSDSNPLPPGTASAGDSDDYSRADHVHPLQNVPWTYFLNLDDAIILTDDDISANGFHVDFELPDALKTSGKSFFMFIVFEIREETAGDISAQDGTNIINSLYRIDGLGRSTLLRQTNGVYTNVGGISVGMADSKFISRLFSDYLPNTFRIKAFFPTGSFHEGDKVYTRIRAYFISTNDLS